MTATATKTTRRRRPEPMYQRRPGEEESRLDRRPGPTDRIAESHEQLGNAATARAATSDRTAFVGSDVPAQQSAIGNAAVGRLAEQAQSPPASAALAEPPTFREPEVEAPSREPATRAPAMQAAPAVATPAAARPGAPASRTPESTEAKPRIVEPAAGAPRAVAQEAPTRLAVPPEAEAEAAPTLAVPGAQPALAGARTVGPDETQRTAAHRPAPREGGVSRRATGGSPLAPAPGSEPQGRPRINTTSPAGLLESLADVPPSAFPQATNEVVAAASRIQTHDKADLQSSFPEVARPTGLPRLPQRSARESVTFERATPPAIQTGSDRQGEPPGTRIDPPVGPVPTYRVSTEVAEPQARQDDGGSWWSWLVDRVRSFLVGIPTRDPGLFTYAGQRPSLDLTGEADPVRNQRLHEASDGQVAESRREADLATSTCFGEDEISPNVPDETLRSSYTTQPPSRTQVGAGVPTTTLPDEARVAVDENGASSVSSQVDQRRQEYQQRQTEYQQQSRVIRDDAQMRMAEETERARIGQAEVRQRARRDVAEHRQIWRHENDEIHERYASASQLRRLEVDEQIQDKVRRSEQQADEKLTQAEAQAEDERRKAEERATAEKNAAADRPRSWWDRFKGAVSRALEVIRSAVNAIFEGLRRRVRQIIAAAKAVVRGLIEAARLAIVGIVKGFGILMKGLVTITLGAFPETAAKFSRWIDDKVDAAVTQVNAIAGALKETIGALLDWLGETLDAGLSVLQTAFNVILDALQLIAQRVGQVMELLAKVWELRKQIGPIVQELMDLIRDPTRALRAIREFFAPIVAQVPARAMSIAQDAITFSEPPKDHWEGIWFYLSRNLAALADNWWEVLKETAWDLIWPLPGVWEDLVGIWDNLTAALGNARNLEFSKVFDNYLAMWRGWNSVLGRLYGWIFLGLVIGFAIAGGVAAVEIGVIPGILVGAAAGAKIAGTIGIVLLASVVAAELATIGKSGYDLVHGSNTCEEDREDYKLIANSALVLAITGVMVAIGAIAARFARGIVSRVASKVWRRPALRGRRSSRGRRIQSRGDVVEVRVALSEKVIALIRRRSVTWLESIRRNWPVIDLLEGGTIRVIPPGQRGLSPRGRPYTTPAYETHGGRLISVKSTARTGTGAQASIKTSINKLANFTRMKNVSVVNPSGRILIVAVETPLNETVMSGLRTYATGRGVSLRIVSSLPPNHPAVIFPAQIPAILADAGIVASENVPEPEDEYVCTE